MTVALGGDGGDELFAGYPMYAGIRWAEFYNRLPSAVRQGIVEPIVNLLPVKTKNLSFDYKAQRFVAGSKYDAVMRHHVWFGSFTPEEQSDLLTPEALASSDGDIYAQARQFAEECDNGDPVTRMQSVDTRLYLAEDILTKVDRASMAVRLKCAHRFSIRAWQSSPHRCLATTNCADTKRSTF